MNDGQRLDYYSKLPYRLEIIPDTEEGGYAARYPQLKGCITCGDTLEEVVRNARDAKTAWLETAIRYGDHIPMPDDDSIEERLLPVARKWAGNIPVWAAVQAGIAAASIRRWAAGNPDVICGLPGVYTWYCDDDGIDWDATDTARFLAFAGPGAFLWGPSVLEFMDIGDVGGVDYDICVPKRRRPRYGVRWVVSDDDSDVVEYRGLRMQSLRRAVACAMPVLDRDKQDSVIVDIRNHFPSERTFINAVAARYGSPCV